MHHATVAVVLAAALLACGSGDRAAPLPPRTVSGRFETVHRTAQGATVVLPGAPPDNAVLSALLVPDGGASGWRSLPAQVDANGAFAVADVPAGTYWLRLDAPSLFPDEQWSPVVGSYFEYVTGTRTELVPAVADAPDLSLVAAWRPDLARTSASTPVTTHASNLEPWVDGSLFLAVSADADVLKDLSFTGAPPAAGGVDHAFVEDWYGVSWLSSRTPGLPDAAKGDALTCYQVSGGQTVTAGSAAATVSRATRRVRVDGLTLQDGVPATFDAPLAAPAETASVPTAVRASLYAALAADVNPTAVTRGLTVTVRAAPRALAYPDRPWRTSAWLAQLGANAAADRDFGPLTWARVLDPGWEEYVAYSVSYTVPIRGVAGTVVSFMPASSAPVPVVPVLGPPRGLKIDGADAYASHAVGPQPVLSWSPPSVGAATSYTVSIRSLTGLKPGGIGELLATVYGATSFKVPPGILAPGVSYYAIVTAQSADWDAPTRAPFRTGYPFHLAQTISGVFTP